MRIETKLFKGKPVIGFYKTADKKFPDLAFGVGKAKIILENIEVIRAFVTANEVLTAATVEETAAESDSA